MRLAIPSAAIAAVATVALVGCASTPGGAVDGAETRALPMATPISEQSVQGQSVAAWIDAVEEATDGSIQIEVHSSGSLLAGTDILPGLVDGRADLGMS